MQEFIDFVEQHEPGFSSRIRGASREELLKLEAQAGRKLPPSYRLFLERMGKDLGGFEIPQVDLRIDRVLEFYEVTKPAPPARYIFIGAHDEDPYIDYYLDCESPQGIACRVIRAEYPKHLLAPEKLGCDFSSFEDMLFVWAFRNRLSFLPLRRGFSPAYERNSQGMIVVPPGVQAGVEALALRLGFQKIPHTSPLTALFERWDAALYISQTMPDGGVTAELAARDPREFRRLEEAIIDNTQLM